ncbi:MAG: hypothetical protein GTO41_17730, partial [Burkholderiales bacterium]|nr:hypothetical protein [Burkholderiales bacterium]
TATKPVTGEAYAAAAEVPALPSVELTEDILYDILVGEIAGQRGQFDIAIASLGRVAERTRDPRLAERATLAAVYAKRYNEALKNAELWVKLQPSSQQAHESLASILMEVNKPSEARRHLEKALSIAASEQTQDRAYRRIASVLGRHQNRQAAMEVMQALVDLDRANPNAYLALAHLAVRTD